MLYHSSQLLFVSTRKVNIKRVYLRGVNHNETNLNGAHQLFQEITTVVIATTFLAARRHERSPPASMTTVMFMPVIVVAVIDWGSILLFLLLPPSGGLAVMCSQAPQKNKTPCWLRTVRVSVASARPRGTKQRLKR